MYKPDFKTLKNTLLCIEKRNTPLIEMHINNEFKQKFFSKNDITLQDNIRLSLELGHDFIIVSKGILKPAQSIGKTTEKGGKLWASESDSIINSLEDIRQYDWMDPDREDFSEFAKLENLMPEGMQILATGGKIFTASWMLLGFNNFCMYLYENENLVKKLFEKVGSLQYRVFEKMLEFKGTGAVAAVDDIAYTEGLMVSAKFLRDNLFPWYEKMGKVCNKRNIPFIYHSDGDLSEIIDDLISCGFNAIHPIEPKAMEIGKLKEKYGRKLCFLGNIEMDTLIRGTVDEVTALVKKNLKLFARDGFYGCGSSNTITEAMPVENVIAMCKAVRNM